MALIPYIWLLSILHERDSEILVLITQIKAVQKHSLTRAFAARKRTEERRAC